MLIPVLDNSKHYWVDRDEIEKLLRKGEKWLPSHPKKELITRRYLRHRNVLAEEALLRLTEEEGDPLASQGDEPADEHDGTTAPEAEVSSQTSLHDQRLNDVHQVLKDLGASRVIDLGCGEGRLLQRLLRDRQFTVIVGMDVAHQQLERAQSRLKLDRLPPTVASRLTLLHGSLMYRDSRLSGFDAAAVAEVVEHLDPARLQAFQRVLFEFARPQAVVLTTPNKEYNALFEAMDQDQLRHKDHRFEWTREEMEHWANDVADQYSYEVSFRSVGPVDATHGAPSQMAIFRLRGEHASP